MAKRILLECTPSYSTDMITGIQRVVRNLVEESHSLGAYESYELVPVIFYEGNLYQLPDSAFTSSNHSSEEGVVSLKFKLFQALSKSKFYLFLKDKVRTNLYSLFIKVREVVHAFVIKHKIGCGELTPINIGSGDIFVLLDVNWGRKIWNKVGEIKAQGACVSLVLYDLIRITHPEFCGAKSSEEYRDFMNIAVHKVDAILSISHAVQDELVLYINSQQDIKYLPKLDYFYLGAESKNRFERSELRNELNAVFSGDKSVYLIVSTIEPRKNHAYLLDAFEVLWDKGVDVKLLIVGRVGWMVDDLMLRINLHPELGRHLFVFHDLDDAELFFCYRHAKALVFPSLTEGFGLPIIESLQNGLPVIASDIPVHREIAQDNAMYVNPEKPGELVGIIKQIEANGIDERYLTSNFVWMNWLEATKQFLQKVIEVSQ